MAAEISPVIDDENDNKQTIEERIQHLESSKIPPTQTYTLIAFLALLPKHPDFVKLIDKLNIKDWDLQYNLENSSGVRHSLENKDCEACGFSKCRKSFLNRNDFDIIIKIKVNPCRYYHIGGYHYSQLSDITENKKIVKKIKNLIFSSDKYKNSSFLIRWYYIYLAYTCLQHIISPSEETKQYILQYKDSQLDFLYLKDADIEQQTDEGEHLICTLEVEVEEVIHFSTLTYGYSEFIQKEDEVFNKISERRIAL